MSKYEVDVEAFDAQVDLLYSHIDKFANDDSEDFSQDLIQYANMAYLNGWAGAIDMVIDVVGEMYNGFDPVTLEELRQRIV